MCGFLDIVKGVMSGEIPPVRPLLPTTGNFDVKLIEMIRECWNEDPGLRPGFSTLKNRYFGLYKGQLVYLGNKPTIATYIFKFHAPVCETARRSQWPFISRISIVGLHWIVFGRVKPFWKSMKKLYTWAPAFVFSYWRGIVIYTHLTRLVGSVKRFYAC